ncbi:HNH endonuclease [Cupriavidus pampae]|uniref:HNH nuclease domain-containing protein n=1 Tax=Cupriavidus pampae TaxID=659251 RepID=A0ABM8Y1W5_9BURK|nr:HNH endonuclease [Cupriavidus pampae]CAG9186724.1 hypothetical protein LMG32289_06585 [Cupriavidus pampae]
MGQELERDGAIAFYWVNVGKTIKEVLKGSFLWAPKESRTKSGKPRRLEHWDNVATVRSGDIIFCCHDQVISHIAQATHNAYSKERPATRSFSEWEKTGNRVDVELHKLETPIHRDDIAAGFVSLYDQQCKPSIFTRDATITQIYMSMLPKEAGVYLLELADLMKQFEADFVDRVVAKRKLSKTTKETIVRARIGQGPFRADLLRRWNRKCSLTGLSNTDLLIASHIHAWTLSDNDQRIDPDNGLLLAPHIDRLFDRGLISFDDDGQLLISPTLKQGDCELLALDKYTKLRHITAENRRYMALHRDRHGFEQS